MRSWYDSMRALDISRKFGILVIAMAAVAACGGGDDDTGTNPTPAIGISVSPTSLSLAQGANGTVTATVSRSGGFANSIDLSLEGAPTGVTAAFSPTSVASGSTTSTITITAASTTAPGNYTLTLRAKGTGVTDQTASVALTVTAVAAGAYTLAVTPATVSVTPGGAAGSATINLTRTGGFTGAVALATTGAPTGLTVTANPTSATGNTSALSITAAANTAPGTYTITVNGTATGVTNQSATFAVTVTAPSSGNASYQFCTSQTPLWFAVQDGTGAWTRVTPTNNVFSFSISSTKGGVAYVQSAAGGGFNLTVMYGLKQELTDAGVGLCASTTEKTVTGSVSGLATGEAASVSLGGALASAPTNGNFTLNNVPDGPRDLIATKTLTSISGSNVTLTVNKLIIRRAQNPAAGGTLPVLNFGAAEAFDPVQKNLTINGIGTDLATVVAGYVTATNPVTTLYTDINLTSSGTRTYFGVPAAQQATGDLHQLTVTALNSTGSTVNYARLFGTYFKDATDKTITLGPVPATATVSVISTTPYVRLRAQWTAQPEYNKFFNASFSQSTGAAARTSSVGASAGYVGGTTVDLSIPDFTGVAGWDSNWGLKAGAATSWVAQGLSWSATGGINNSPAVEGGTLQAGLRFGTITP